MKFLRIVFILLFLVMSMGLVSAQDNLTDTLQADISATDDVGSFEELEYDITNANSTLEITKDYRNDNYPDGITIARDNLVINGNNHTLDGNGQNIFFFKGSNITINNLVFKNAYYPIGGGAIYNSGTITLNNVSFIDNCAGGGGAICNSGTITLNNASFVGSVAADAGGAIYNLGLISLNNVSFVDNCAGESGGAIFNGGEFVLDSVSFVDNGASWGGAIYEYGNSSLSGCVFANNSARWGGAAYICGGCVMDCNNVSFVDNCAGDSGGAVYNLGTIDLNNVSFGNNDGGDFGGALYSEGESSLSNVSFVDNVAKQGGAIYSYCGGLDICNTFITSKKSAKYGQVYSKYSIVSIDNLTVVNITAPYSPAMYIESSDAHLSNSRFVNLTANVSAGAITAKAGGNIYIKGCEFINTSSSKNAGALNFDIVGDDEYTGNVSILDTLFEDTSSGFGGAIIQLGGNLLLNNSHFIKNSATFDGGAVYLSHVNALINGCTFDSDSIGVFDDYPTYGGAIYFDCGNLTVNNSRFFNTSSYIGSGAICIYDSLYEIVDSTFGDGEAVHAIFKRNGSQVVNCSGNFTICDENVFYPYVIVGEGMNLTPIDDELDFDVLPTHFDWRDYNLTSPVRNQGYTGACWAVSSTGALESALLKSFGLSVDISENNMQHTMLQYSKYGASTSGGGSVGLAAAYLLSWLGAIPEDLDTFDEIGKISPVIIGSGNIHIQDAVFNMEDYKIVNDNSRFKQDILKYGVLACSIYSEDWKKVSNEFYNVETYAQYAFNIILNHEVCVVGWDDSFSRENFMTAPPGDGAWICKNSYGTDFGDEGYFYVSYYDETLCTNFLDAAAILFENRIPYNKNYQYDFPGFEWDFYEGENPITYLNKFEACDDDLIAAVGTYFDSEGIEYKVEIEVNGELVYTQEGISPYCGYHTIRLDKYIPIKKGDNFSAAITSNAIPYALLDKVRLHYTHGISYKFENGSWVDLYDEGMIACLKVYTVADDSKVIDNKDIQVDYGKKSWFGVRVVTADGYAVVGADVDFTINGKAVTVKTDSDGTAKIEISEEPGVYVIKTEYDNQTYKNKVTVKSKGPDEKNKSDDKKRSDVKVYGKGAAKPNFYTKTIRPYFQPVNREDVVIVAENSVVSQKEFSEGYSYKITLKSKNGKALANKKVIIIFNGMIFVGYTDENGTVCFNLTGNMTGLFSITIIFEGDDYYNPICENRTIRIE